MEEQNQDEQTTKTSPAKAAIARQKTRDAHGRFLSAEEQQAYNAQVQAQQFAAERAKIGNLLGKSQAPTQNIPMQGQIPQNNFQNMINANTPGKRNQTGELQIEGDKWDILLGKKKSLNTRW